MKGLINTRFILLNPSSLHTTKSSATSPPPSPIFSSHRRWVILFLSLFTLASLLTLLSTASTGRSPPLSFSPALGAESGTRLPSHIFDTLLHYASLVNSSAHMPEPDMLAIAAVLRRRAPCNMLVFGLGAESALWRSLNHGGRTVFLDENSYYAEYMEGKHPGIEAYDVSYTTQVSIQLI
jgi:Polysaccharide biosynthesis